VSVSVKPASRVAPKKTAGRTGREVACRRARGARTVTAATTLGATEES